MVKGVIQGKDAIRFAKRAKQKDFVSMMETEVLPELRLNKKIDLADFCTGSGNIIPFLKDKVKSFTAIEYGDKFINMLNKKYGKDIKIIKGDVTSLKNIKDNQYDIITFKFSLHHIKAADNVFEEAHRLLRPKGKLVLIDMVFKSNILTKIYEPIWKLRKSIKQGWHELHCKYRNEKQIEFIIKKNNFKIIKKKQLSGKNSYRDKHYPAFIYIMEKRQP